MTGFVPAGRNAPSRRTRSNSPVEHEVVRSRGDAPAEAGQAEMRAPFVQDFSRVRTHAEDRVPRSSELVHRVTEPGDATERAATAIERRTAAEPAALAAMTEFGASSPKSAPLPAAVRHWAESAMGADFSRVRVHSDARAADAIDASAFASGDEIVFGAGFEPALLVHELAHVAAGTPAGTVARKTKGEEIVDRAHQQWLDPAADLKADIDKLKAALDEMLKDKSVAFNHKAGLKLITSAVPKAAGGNAKVEQAAKADWDWLAQHRKSAGTAEFESHRKALFGNLRSALAVVTEKHPGAQTTFWLKNTPPQVLDVVLTSATAVGLPPEELWTYAMKEGLAAYVRDEIGLGRTADPTTAQLAGVSTSKEVEGFTYLGTDDFFADLNAKREPAKAFLPSGYDLTKAKPATRVNEHGRTVNTVTFANLATGLQGLGALLRRRRALFLDDAKANGYGTPTTEETVYWTYVYYNAGENNGQLKKHAGKRKLADWITKHEFPNSMKVLESYRMIRGMGIF
jgi:hypothetical protein